MLALLVAGKSNRAIAERLVVELGTVKSYLNQIYHKLNVRSRVQAIVRARELDLIAQPAVHSTGTSYIYVPSNPYKGLQAFQAADERDFFGRERMTARLLERLGSGKQPTRFLAVVGPSGSGKSSLVKAGLIPALWRGAVKGSERWFVAEMLPGSHPLDELEVALSRVAVDHRVNLGEQLQRDERGLLRAAQLILPNDGSELLLVVDQLEELFTLVTDEDQRQRFLALLGAAVGELLRDHTELVLPLSAEELEQAIARPADAQHIVFEEGLVAKIVSEVRYEPGALPLLQYALTELFEHREGCC